MKWLPPTHMLTMKCYFTGTKTTRPSVHTVESPRLWAKINLFQKSVDFLGYFLLQHKANYQEYWSVLCLLHSKYFIAGANDQWSKRKFVFSFYFKANMPKKIWMKSEFLFSASWPPMQALSRLPWLPRIISHWGSRMVSFLYTHSISESMRSYFHGSSSQVYVSSKMSLHNMNFPTNLTYAHLNWHFNLSYKWESPYLSKLCPFWLYLE